MGGSGQEDKEKCLPENIEADGLLLWPGNKVVLYENFHPDICF